MQPDPARQTIGLDFGTTNTVAALAKGGSAELVRFAGDQATGAVFRSALCFWQQEGARGGIDHEAGPWAIAEYLDFPLGSRFIQSFKSVAASPLFEQASVFNKRFRFEELGQMFLEHLVAHSGGGLGARGARIVVGRPVAYAGARADAALARERYDRMFASLGAEIAPDIARIDACVEEALARAGRSAEQIDRVFLTGGSSLIPAIRRLFAARFGEERIADGDELTSIAHGLALIGEADNLDDWSV